MNESLGFFAIYRKLERLLTLYPEHLVLRVSFRFLNILNKQSLQSSLLLIEMYQTPAPPPGAAFAVKNIISVVYAGSKSSPIGRVFAPLSVPEDANVSAMTLSD